jgi:hypothetical protein
MLPRIKLRRPDQVVRYTEAEEAEIVAEIVAGSEVDAAEVEIVVVIVVIVAVQAAAVTRKATADRATGQLIKVAETAEAIRAVQQPVRIRIEAAAGQLQAENPGTKNKPENREGRRRGFSLLR